MRLADVLLAGHQVEPALHHERPPGEAHGAQLGQVDASGGETAGVMARYGPDPPPHWPTQSNRTAPCGLAVMRPGLAAGGAVSEVSPGLLVDGDRREAGRVLGGELRTD